MIAVRLALYQFRWLDRIPQRAALHESVELVKRARKRSAAPFVNAVLRKLSENRLSDSVPPVVSLSSPQALAAAYAHPEWLVERWSRDYGLTAAQQICQYDQGVPPTAIRLRTPEAESELASEGVSLSPGALLSSARRIASGDITETQSFRNRHVVIQDEGSQLVAALIGSAGNTRVLDCCAAPGGKTLAISDQNPDAAVTAVELHPHRAHLMQRLFPVDIADARDLPLAQPYDRILADVPCSGTGTLARNPEIKWRLRLEDLAELQERQLAILRSAMSHLAPGGRLIYSTCSLEKEENEDVVEQALTQNSSFRQLDCRPELDRLKANGELAWLDASQLTRGPYLRTIPGIHPCDGFFAAIVERI
jgi:16S rRNA (cytosine967-C5)-methyltransferase